MSVYRRGTFESLVSCILEDAASNGARAVSILCTIQSYVKPNGLVLGRTMATCISLTLITLARLSERCYECETIGGGRARLMNRVASLDILLDYWRIHSVGFICFVTLRAFITGCVEGVNDGVVCSIVTD